LSCNNTNAGNQDNKDCSTVECSEDNDQCEKVTRDCNSAVLITAIALTAGVIAGIVVGIVAFIACAGGASYAAFQTMGSGAVNAVVNNPLYKGENKQGNNPLYKADA